MNNTVLISDNFLSSGNTSIRNINNETIGYLHLKSIFRSVVSVTTLDETIIASGQFKALLGKWTVYNEQNQMLGTIASPLLSFSKNFIYKSCNKGKLTIQSPALSRNYIIYNDRQQEVGSFKRTNKFYASPAYKVHNKSDVFTIEELIIVVMGVNAIQKQSKQSSSN